MGEKDLLSGRKDELRSWERKGYCPREELPSWKKGVTTHTERSYYPGREGVSTLEERISYFLERVTALREELIPKKELLPWVSTPRGVTILAEKEFLHWKKGWITFLRVTTLREELIPWKRSYFRELLHREELLPGREGVSTLEERMSYFPERVTALREELIPWRSYYPKRAKEYQSYYLAEKEFLHWKRELVIFMRKSYCSEIGVITLKKLLP